jgi:hypothetical protein
MACVCLGRALLLPVLAVRHPELRNTFAIVAAIVWGTAGVGLAVAFRLAKAGPNSAFKPNSFRSANNMAEKACHVLGSATRVGLT